MARSSRSNTFEPVRAAYGTRATSMTNLRYIYLHTEGKYEKRILGRLCAISCDVASKQYVEIHLSWMDYVQSGRKKSNIDRVTRVFGHLVGMACLYIDRSKGDFQRTEHNFFPFPSSNENWCPRFLINCLRNCKFEDYCASKASQVKYVSTNFAPKEPTVYTIGLRLNSKSRDHDTEFWIISNIKKLLQKYLNVALSYQSYLHVSWKPVDYAVSFTSVVSTVSKSSNKLASHESFSNEEANFKTLRCEYRRSLEKVPSDNHYSSKDGCDSKLLDERYTDSFENQRSQNVRKETYPVVDKDVESMGPPIRKSKRNACVQTSRRKSRRKKRKKDDVEHLETEICAFDPTEKSSSKNIKTIFKADGTYFNYENSKSSVELRYVRQTTQRIKGKPSENRDKKRKKYTRRQVSSENNYNSTTIYRKFSNESRVYENIGTSSAIVCKDTQFKGGFFVADDYKMEDKISEMMILGNVKKRLEEDYDEYFSVNEFDLETDPPSWDTKIRESRERPMGIDVTDDCVVCASNLDLNRSHSSYYSSLREHDCTPSSSIEYCSATNVSLTRLRSEIESLSVQRSSLIDASFDDNEDFQDSREFLDKGLASPATNVSNSKLITESLDSGILTDYSRHLLRAPQDRSQKKSQSSNQVRRYAREWDLLPTYDFDTDSSYSDESLDRRVDVAVKKFTENLILAERRARVKLRLLENPASHRQGRKRRKRVPQVKKVSECILKCSPACRFESPHWWTDDDRILSSSTPPLFSFSDSEIDHV